MVGILFDIDDTLYSRRALLLQAARDTLMNLKEAGQSGSLAVCGEAGSAAEDHFMKTFYRFGDENYPLVVTGQITPWESNVWRFVKTVTYLGVEVTQEDGEAFANRYTYLQEHMTMSDELHDVMKKLSDCPGIRPGVMTNGASKFQWKKVYMLGLDRYVEEKSVFVSGDLGVSKPDPGIFHAAEERFGLTPDDLWIVGDSLKHDIAGAKACGWHALWLRRNPEDTRLVEPDLTADSESEMCRLLLTHFVPSEDQSIQDQ